MTTTETAQTTQVVAIPAASTPAVPTPFATASLYVGDLRPEVMESQLFDIFKTVGSVASIRVNRDAISRRSLGYAYVNFHKAEDAARALDGLNYTEINGKPCRIMWSLRDPSRRKLLTGNVFIKNMDKSITNQLLYDTFSAFGNILSCKVETDDKGVSKGFGYVHFDNEKSATDAIEQVNGKLIAGKKVFVARFVSRKDRSTEGQDLFFTNVYIKNLETDMDESKLTEVFSKFGDITSAVVIRDAKGVSRGFGFVNFKAHESAVKAVAEGDKIKIGEKSVTVCRAQKKSERSRELKARFAQLKAEHPQQGQNLYVRNLYDTINDDELRTIFEPFGSITSARVMIDRDSKVSRGFGFVSFSTPEEAHKAISELNGALIHNKPLYVAIAQKKEVRRQQLEAQHLQRMHPQFPTMAPAYLQQPIFYAPSMMPSAGNRYMFGVPQQQGMMRGPAGWRQGMQPNVAAGPHRGPYQQMPPYNMQGSMPRSRQQGRRGGMPPANMQMKPGDAQVGWRLKPSARNQQFPAQQQVAQPAMAAAAAEIPQPAAPAVQPAVVQQPTVEEQEQVAQAPATVDYASLPPEEQRQAVGEQLFGFVYQQYSNDEQRCGKITGMLLESMEIADLIKLLEVPEEIAKKIEEANVVYEAHQHKIADEQFAAQATEAAQSATEAQ